MSLSDHVTNLVLLESQEFRNFIEVCPLIIWLTRPPSNLACFLAVLVFLTLLILSQCGIFLFLQNPQPLTLPQRRHCQAAAPLKLWKHPPIHPCHPAQGHQRKRHKETERWRWLQRGRQKKRKLYVFSTAPSARWPSTPPPSCRLTTAVRDRWRRCRQANPALSVFDPSADVTLYLLRH